LAREVVGREIKVREEREGGEGGREWAHEEVL